VSVYSVERDYSESDTSIVGVIVALNNSLGFLDQFLADPHFVVPGVLPF